ncbi:hypothetical protein D3C75_692410 [compost metagenome]
MYIPAWDPLHLKTVLLIFGTWQQIPKFEYSLLINNLAHRVTHILPQTVIGRVIRIHLVAIPPKLYRAENKQYSDTEGNSRSAEFTRDLLNKSIYRRYKYPEIHQDNKGFFLFQHRNIPKIVTIHSKTHFISASIDAVHSLLFHKIHQFPFFPDKLILIDHICYFT